MKDKELAVELEGWFQRVTAVGVPLWVSRSSPVFFVMRDRLKEMGYWRALPRGNPKKGYLVSRKGQAYE